MTIAESLANIKKYSKILNDAFDALDGIIKSFEEVMHDGGFEQVIRITKPSAKKFTISGQGGKQTIKATATESTAMWARAENGIWRLHHHPGRVWDNCSRLEKLEVVEAVPAMIRKIHQLADLCKPESIAAVRAVTNEVLSALEEAKGR